VSAEVIARPTSRRTSGWVLLLVLAVPAVLALVVPFGRHDALRLPALQIYDDSG